VPASGFTHPPGRMDVLSPAGALGNAAASERAGHLHASQLIVIGWPPKSQETAAGAWGQLLLVTPQDSFYDEAFTEGDDV
jgi:hypothetical protein